MDADRKRELRAAYKERKQEVGVFRITCRETGETFLGAAKDIPAAFNRAQFQLNAGLHPNKRLQDEWEHLGESAFEFGVVQHLEHTDSEDDYTDDLEELLDLCLAESPEAKRLIAKRTVR